MRKRGWLFRPEGGLHRLELEDWLGRAAIIPRHRRSHLEDSRVLGEEAEETSHSRMSVFTPAAKCKMILSCQYLSPGLKDLKSYPCLSVVRPAVGLGG